jgi:hypothetical protein
MDNQTKENLENTEVLDRFCLCCQKIIDVCDDDKFCPDCWEKSKAGELIKCADCENYIDISEGDSDMEYFTGRDGQRYCEGCYNGEWEYQLSSVKFNPDGEIENIQFTKHFERGDEKISNTAENYIKKQIAKIENVYREYTTPLICKGIFSNGEAVYEKAK